MKENVISALIIIGVLLIVGFLWFAYENPVLNPKLKEETYVIIRKWDLPEVLEEVSGIHYLSDNKMACVQDEDGIIFIYNLDTDLVEKTINFSKSGDYEGVAIIDSTAYVLESNGKIHQVLDYLGPSFTTHTFKTHFSGKNNMESLSADSINNRLLLSVKDTDPNSRDYKGIYAFDLETKRVLPTPIFKIPLNDPILMEKSSKSDDDGGGTNGGFYPSDLAIHPIDGTIYILEGKTPRLLLMDPQGKLLQLHELNEEFFPQPEGLAFAPDGTLYISNEGKKGTANILEVELKDEWPADFNFVFDFVPKTFAT